jgi:hypothetical protein
MKKLSEIQKMGDFNRYYQSLVAKFMRSGSKRMTTDTKPDGSQWNFYTTEDGGVVCATPMPYYSIPQDMLGLLNMQRIFKHNAHSIKIRIKDPICWEHMMNYTFCGTSWIINYMCFECSVGATDCMCYVRNNTFICIKCYNKNKPPGFTLCDFTEFNVLDWVRFIGESFTDEYYPYYVNCNPKSVYYGKIMVLIDDIFADIFHIIGDCKTFIGYIRDWLVSVPNELPVKSMVDVLHEDCRIPYLHEICVREGFPTSNRFILEHHHVCGDGVFDSKDVRWVYRSMHNKCIYSDESMSKFSVWLSKKF